MTQNNKDPDQIPTDSVRIAPIRAYVIVPMIMAGGILLIAGLIYIIGFTISHYTPAPMLVDDPITNVDIFMHGFLYSIGLSSIVIWAGDFLSEVKTIKQ